MKTKLLITMICGGALLSGCAGTNTQQAAQQSAEQNQVDSTIVAKAAAVEGLTFDHEIKPTIEDNFKLAKFRLWLPQNSQKPQGVLTLTLGANENGLHLVEDPKWRKFATEKNLALVSVYWLNRDEKKPDGSDYPFYFQPKHGTGKALLSAIEHLGQTAGKPQLADLPMLMWGHSAGGQFNYGFASWAPERVIAFTAIKGGIYLPKSQPATLKVPALFFTGELDVQKRIDGIHKVVGTHRDKGALWALANEINGGHGIGHTSELILPFFDKMIEQRLPANVETYRDIVEIPAKTGWMANNNTLTLANSGEQNLKDANLSWLVDYDFAKQWQNYANRLPNHVGMLDYFTGSHQHTNQSVEVVDNEKQLLPILNVYRDSKVLTVELNNDHLSHLLSDVVGTSGELIKTDFNSLYAVEANVEGEAAVEEKAAVDKSGIAEGSIDSIVLIDNYHQLVTTKIDRMAMLATLWKKLKAKGTLTVIDNDVDEADAYKVRWIDDKVNRRLVLDEIMRSGFKWDISTYVEADANTDKAAKPTRKFVLRLTKPAF